MNDSRDEDELLKSALVARSAGGVEALREITKIAERASKKGGAELLAYSGILLGAVSYAARYVLPIFYSKLTMTSDEFFTMMYLASFMIFGAAAIRVWIFATTMQSIDIDDASDDTGAENNSPPINPVKGGRSPQASGTGAGLSN